MATSRRTALALVAALVLLPVTACGGGSSSATPAKYRTVRSGVLTAATQSEQPPFASTDASGRPVGFAVDLVNEAAKRMGIAVEYKTTTLQGMLAGLTAGQYDLGVAGVTATDERRRQADFTAPFYWSSNAVLTGRSGTAGSEADLDGRRVGAVSGSIQEAYAKAKLPKAQLVAFKDQATMVAQLLSGGIDALVVGGAEADTYVAKQPLRIAFERDGLQGVALPLRKGGDPALLRDLDAQIDALIADGTFETLYRKYFKGPVAAALLQARPALAAKVKGTDLEPKGP